MIRRSKENTIELPPRHDKVVRIRFTPDEKVHYRKIEQPVVTMLDDAIGTQKGMGGLWVNAIQQINKLRIACNLGIFTASSQPMQVQPKLKDKDLTLEILATRLSMGDNACEQCLQVIVSSDSNLCSEGRNISLQMPITLLAADSSASAAQDFFVSRARHHADAEPELLLAHSNLFLRPNSHRE